LLALFALSAPVSLGLLYSLGASVGLAGTGARGFDLSLLQAVLTDSTTWRSIGWTVMTALGGTMLATVAALLAAVPLRDARVARALAVLPLAVPHAAGALAILLLLGQSGMLARLAYAAGWITQPAGFPVLVYDRPGLGLMLAFGWKEFPFLLLSALAVLATRGRVHEEAARTLGASPRDVWWRVTLPLLWRGLAPAVVAVFAYLLGQYEMATLLAPSDPVALPVLTYERAMDAELARRGGAYVLALLAMGVTIALVVVHQRLLERSDAPPDEWKG
jgi:putative spermidine/putrescine transport system permease protein